MRILLVHPSNDEIYKRINRVAAKLDKKSAKSPPIGIMYIAATLRENSYKDVAILDAEAENLSFEETVDRMKGYDPDVVGFTTTTPVYPLGVELATAMKKHNPEIKTVFGGPHVSALPDESLDKEAVDFVVRNEGEYKMLDLVETLDSGGDFSRIGGIGWKRNGGTLVSNPETVNATTHASSLESAVAVGGSKGKKVLIDDLDALPFPARDLTDRDRYHNLYTGERYTFLVTSRGCPFGCIYCDSKITFGRKTRYRGVENVIDEIKQVVEDFGIKQFTMTDDTFTLNRQRTLDLCQRIVEEELGISFIASSRADTMDEERARMLKRAGCFMVTFGLESGDPRIMEIINKGTTIEHGREAVRIAKEAGLQTHASYMIGNPGETAESVDRTIKYADELDTDYAQFSIATPFPGTEMWDMAVRDGLIDPKATFEKFRANE